MHSSSSYFHSLILGFLPLPHPPPPSKHICWFSYFLLHLSFLFSLPLPLFFSISLPPDFFHFHSLHCRHSWFRGGGWRESDPKKEKRCSPDILPLNLAPFLSSPPPNLFLSRYCDQIAGAAASSAAAAAYSMGKHTQASNMREIQRSKLPLLILLSSFRPSSLILVYVPS